MSKNFELLQKLGHDEGLFETLEEFSDAPVNPEGPVPSDEEAGRQARDKGLNAASLPNVFEESPSPSLSPAAAFAPNVVEKGHGEKSTLPAAPTSGSFRSPRSSIYSADARSFAPWRTDSAAEPRNVHSNSGANRFPQKELPPDFLHDAHVRRQEQHAPEPHSTIQSREATGKRWLDALRAGARRWTDGATIASDHANYNKTDLETVVREEELKLVQRVFPESGADLRRLALFSSVEGKRSCASICGRTAELLAARGDGPVCAVDANFESPCLHRYFGTENDRGLADASRGPGAIHDFVRQIPEPDLWLLPAGKASPVLNFPAIADGLRSRIMELRSAFRYVVIHAGPLRLQTITMLISRWTDGVVLVLEANSTTRDSAKRATEMLRAANVSLLGVVLNNRTFPIPEPIYRRL